MRLPLYRIRIDIESGPVVECRIFTLPKGDEPTRMMLGDLLRNGGWSLFIGVVESEIEKLTKRKLAA